MSRTSVVSSIAFFIFLILLAVPTYSAVIYVKTDGNDLNDGSSWELAKQTVQAGLNAAVSGDEVWVAAGTYVGLVTLLDGVKLYGGFDGWETSLSQRSTFPRSNPDPIETVLDGNQDISVLYSPEGVTSNTRVDGFTICNADMGIYCISSSPIIVNNTIRRNGNASAMNGGIICYLASPMILNNTIYGNVAFEGGGIFCHKSSPVIANNVICDNNARNGGGIYCKSSDAVVSNNTIVSNRAAYSGGGIYCNFSSPTISNNIIAFNSSGIFRAGSILILNNNCVYNPNPYGYDYQGLSPGIGDISVDPKLADLQYGNMHIQPGSPCIDAGDDSIVQSDWIDMDGQIRIQGEHVDIGADESNGTNWPNGPYCIIRVSPTGDDSNDGSSWALAKKSVQAGINTSCRQCGEVWVAAGIYTEQIAINPYAHLYGGFAGTEDTRDERNWKSNTTVLDGNGGTVVTVAGTINKSTIIDGFTVRNGIKGIYCLFSSLVISNNVITNNLFNGIECELSALNISNNKINMNSSGIYTISMIDLNILNNHISNNRCEGICCSSISATISSNVITNNSGEYCGGIICYANNIIINKNMITNNKTEYNGGGIHLSRSTSALISDNIISGNNAGYIGGGIFCNHPDKAIIISNNIILGNHAENGGGIYSGGMHNRKDTLVHISNNTIVGNIANSNGGGVYCESPVSLLYNNIVTFNTSGIYKEDPLQIYLAHNNCVYGNTAYNYLGLDPGEGDISLDPLFRDPLGGDYHLTGKSPCINAGWNDAPGLPELDIDGEGRICWDVVDIGADEYWPIKVEIDIKPGESPNCINLKSKGLVPVAILSTPSFDAASVDPSTVTLAEAGVAAKGSSLCSEIYDVNKDGLKDLLLRFDTQSLILALGAEDAQLIGRTYDGEYIEGSDSVRIINSK